MKKNELIVTMTHTNYCLMSAGTEKFVRDYSDLLQKCGYDNLAFFPIAEHSVKIEKKVGVIYDDKFIGIYNYKDIGIIIKNILVKHNLALNSIQIQHLKDHDVNQLVMLVQKFQVPLFLFVHDYYWICQSVKLIREDKRPCGYQLPSNEKCKGCEAYPESLNHSKKINTFLNQVYPYISKVIVPSDFVYNVILQAFPLLRDKVIVRNHLILSGHKTLPPINGKVKVAFVGAQVYEKGFDKFKLLVSQIAEKYADDYEFYYFGYGTEKIEHVHNVFVANSKNNGYTMDQALSDYNISCALCVCVCGETYSYVYYEMSLAGAFVITNSISGNITDQVKKNRNGIIFDDFEECINWFKIPENVRKSINEYRIHSEYTPVRSENNTILYINDDRNKNYNFDKKQVSKVNRSLFTYIYVLKHLLFHNGERNILDIVVHNFR